jgi:membrane-bound lytic murein transglycosylase D
MARVIVEDESLRDGLQFEPIPNQPYFGIVDPGKQVHLGEAADLAGISRDDMFALNPAFNRMTTPPSGPHRLLLPVGNVEPFRAALASEEGVVRLAAAAAAPPPDQRHQVRRGDSLYAIAGRFRVSVDDIVSWNSLDPAKHLQPGQTLKLRTGG